MFLAILTTVTIGVTLLFPSLGLSPSEVVEVIQPEILSTPIEYPGRHPNSDASVASLTSSQEDLYNTLGEWLAEPVASIAEPGVSSPSSPATSQFDVESYMTDSPATVYSDDVNHYGDPASPEYKYGGSEYNY